MKEIFTNIVLSTGWGQHPCGPGSTMNYTQNIREKLVPLIEKHNITSMLDLPCGDFSWMSTTGIHNKIKYIGADIVEELIKSNKNKYLDTEFKVLDLTVDILPSVDLLFCRDCLLHLSFSDIDKAFTNIANSNIKYVLLSNWYGDAENNRDIKTGSNRYINFMKAPYSFVEGIDSIDDWITGFPERRMILWEVETIRNYIREKK